jgi:restriction system protein
MTEQKLARSRELASRVVYDALKVLSENGGEMRTGELLQRVESRLELDDWARGVYETTGYVRWQSILHFFSIDSVKAGFLIKRNGVWFLTPEGEEAIKKMGPVELMLESTRRYREWRKANPAQNPRRPNFLMKASRSKRNSVNEMWILTR